MVRKVFSILLTFLFIALTGYIFSSRPLQDSTSTSRSAPAASSVQQSNAKSTAPLRQSTPTPERATATPKRDTAAPKRDTAAPKPSAANNTTAQKTYILNTNTKKFHLPTCSSVKQMAEKNKKTYTGTRTEVISMGYSPCQRCYP